MLLVGFLYFIRKICLMSNNGSTEKIVHMTQDTISTVMWNTCVVDSCGGWKGAFVGQQHADFCGFLSNAVERTLVVCQGKNFSMGMLLLQALCSHLHNNHHYYSDIYDISSDVFIFLKTIFGGGGNGWNKWHRWGDTELWWKSAVKLI